MTRTTADKGSHTPYSVATMIAFFPSTVTPVTHFLHAETLFCPLPKLLPEFPGSHLQERHAYFHHLIYANSTNSRSRSSVLFSTKVSRKIAGLPVLTIVYVKSIRASNPPISGPASLLKMPFQLIKFIWLFICKYFLKNYDRCLLILSYSTTNSFSGSMST